MQHSPLSPPTRQDLTVQTARGRFLLAYRVIPQETWIIARQDYLGGTTTAEVAAKHGISVVALKRRANAEKWKVQKAKTLAKHDTTLMRLDQAADRRAEATAATWQAKVAELASLISSELPEMHAVATRARQVLTTTDFADASIVDACGILASMTSSMDRLAKVLSGAQAMLPKASFQPRETAELTDAELQAIIEARP